MAEQNLGVYLTDAERNALDQQRTLDIARALQMQAHLLFLWGVNEEDVQVGVDAMRNRIQDASDDELKKVRKALSKTVQLIEAMQPVASVTPLPVQEVVHPVEERQLEQPTFDTPSDIHTSTEHGEATATEESTVSDTSSVSIQTRVSDNLAESESEKRSRSPQQQTTRYNKHNRVVECPEGLPKEVNYLFLTILPLEYRERIVNFSDQQNDALASLVESLYAKYSSSKPVYRERQVDRLKRLLSGVSGQEIAEQDGLSSTTLYQSFRVSLPSMLYPHKNEFRQGFERIMNMPESVAEIHGEETTDALVVHEQHEMEPRAPEPVVELVQKIYKTDDPEVASAIYDLFSMNNGVRSVSDETIHAAQTIRNELRSKGVNLNSIADSSARAVVERLLGGIRIGDSVQWMTLSETLRDTPEGVREKKRRSVEAAFRKIADQIVGEKSVVTDGQEELITHLRNELYKYIGATRELGSRIIDRAIGEDTIYDADMSKAMMMMYREVAGSLNDEVDTSIIRKFVTPLGGRPPSTIGEIAERVTIEQQKVRKGTRTYSDAIIRSRLLRIFGSYIKQKA